MIPAVSPSDPISSAITSIPDVVDKISSFIKKKNAPDDDTEDFSDIPD